MVNDTDRLTYRCSFEGTCSRVREREQEARVRVLFFSSAWRKRKCGDHVQRERDNLSWRGRGAGGGGGERKIREERIPQREGIRRVTRRRKRRRKDRTEMEEGHTRKDSERKKGSDKCE